MQVTTPLLRDMHIHLRQGELLDVIKYSSPYCSDIMAMPNTVPPLLGAKDVVDYKNAVELAKKRVGSVVNVHYTLYVNEETTAEVVKEAAPHILACKVYPKMATTNSDLGVLDYTKIIPALEAMEEHDIVLCLHGEHPNPRQGTSVLGWEAEFVERVLPLIRYRFPKLRIVLEHITTVESVQAVMDMPKTAGTITAHHLYLTVDDILAHGIKPLNYCKPVAKFRKDLRAIREAALNANYGKFFFGSDSAPHDEKNKFCACGAAGCFTAPIAYSLLLEFFLKHNHQPATGSLSGGWQANVEHIPSEFVTFTSQNAGVFYDLKLSSEEITFTRDEDGVVPMSVECGGKTLPLFQGGEAQHWVISSREGD